MSFAQQVFGKPISDLTLDDVQTFFAVEQEETDTFEMKSGPVDNDKIYKAVSALLNTSGGLFIIGAPRERTLDGGLKVCVGDLTFDRTLGNSDRIHQRLASHITPSPVGVRIKELRGPEGSVYVFDVPQSSYAPHQCNDSRYYIRLERESRPASHGFVEALFNRRQRPQLESEIYFFDTDGSELGIQIELACKSRLSTEQVGSVIEVVGISEMIPDDSGDGDVTQIDKSCFYGQAPTQKILVQGMKATFAFRAKPIDSEVTVYMSSWCKDGELHSQTKVISVVDRTVLISLDSRTDADAPLDYFSRRLEARSPELAVPAIEPQRITDNDNLYGIRLNSWEVIHDGQGASIVGSFSNNSQRTYGNITVHFDLFNGQRMRLESISTFVGDVTPGEHRIDMYISKDVFLQLEDTVFAGFSVRR